MHNIIPVWSFISKWIELNNYHRENKWNFMVNIWKFVTLICIKKTIIYLKKQNKQKSNILSISSIFYMILIFLFKWIEIWYKIFYMVKLYLYLCYSYCNRVLYFENVRFASMLFGGTDKHQMLALVSFQF